MDIGSDTSREEPTYGFANFSKNCAIKKILGHRGRPLRCATEHERFGMVGAPPIHYQLNPALMKITTIAELEFELL